LCVFKKYTNMHGTLFVGTTVLFVIFIIARCFRCNSHLQVSVMEHLNCMYCTVPLLMFHTLRMLWGCLPEDKRYNQHSCNTGRSCAVKMVTYIIIYECGDVYVRHIGDTIGTRINDCCCHIWCTNHNSDHGRTQQSSMLNSASILARKSGHMCHRGSYRHWVAP
jgi:hypothetical protein